MQTLVLHSSHACSSQPKLRSQPLMEVGLDSLGAVELQNALGTKFRIELPATTVLDYPTAAALAAHLAARMAAAAGAEDGVVTVGGSASEASLDLSSAWNSVRCPVGQELIRCLLQGRCSNVTYCL